MSYQKTEWIDYETLVSAENLNNIEEGLSSVSQKVTVVEGEFSTVKAEVESLKLSVSDGKTKIAGAITDKGVSTPADATFEKMATNIGKIKTGYAAYDSIPKDKVKRRWRPTWSYSSHSGLGILAITIDKDGYVYIVNNHNKLYKLNADGEEVWVFEGITSTTADVAVDRDSNVFVVTSGGEVIKVDSEGSQAWKYTSETSVQFRSLALWHPAEKQNAAPYVGDTEGYLHIISSDKGTLVTKQQMYTASLNSVYVDSIFDSKNFYSCSSDKRIKKNYDSLGHDDFTFTGHTASVMGVTADAEGNVYSCDASGVVKKIKPTNPSGTEDWSTKITSNSIQKIRLDSKGNVYCSDNRGIVYKLDNHGEVIAQYTWKANSIIKIAVDDNYVYASANNKPHVERLEEVYYITE